MKSLLWKIFPALLIGSILLSSCIKEVPPPIPPPEPAPLLQFQESLPIDDTFLGAIEQSSRVQLFAENFVSRDLHYAYDLGVEYIVEGMPEEAQGARHAAVPVLDREGSLAYLLFYTYNPETKTEGVDLLEQFVNAEGQEVMRFYTDTNLETGFDLVADANGAGIQAIAFGIDSEYIKCVLQRLVLWGAMNQATMNFCITQCLSGGIYNPACLTCIAGAAILITAAWWSC